MLCAFGLGVIAFSSGYRYNSVLFQTLNFDTIYELTILCGAIIGGGLAFFLYNRYPAKIFMGDVGSLMYGAFLGSVAVFLRYEMFYFIAGLLFVIEAMSSTLQVASWRLFGKRIFKMAPIHHHFEKMGWSERKIVWSFWGFSFVCLLIAFVSIL
jgi:phospho-N-acetylmuramoyl-pentapeptide-transferase